MMPVAVKQIPGWAMCPISQDWMINPIRLTLKGGQETYLDRASYDSLINKKICPFKKIEITSYALDEKMRVIINDFKRERELLSPAEEISLLLARGDTGRDNELKALLVAHPEAITSAHFNEAHAKRYLLDDLLKHFRRTLNAADMAFYYKKAAADLDIERITLLHNKGATLPDDLANHVIAAFLQKVDALQSSSRAANLRAPAINQPNENESYLERPLHATRNLPNWSKRTITIKCSYVRRLRSARCQ